MITDRERDALIATRVMGWKYVPYTAYADERTAIAKGWYYWVDADGNEIDGQLEENSFSTDIAAAWKIAERMLGNYSYYFHLEYDSVHWCVTLVHVDTRQEIKTSDIRASRAIASAALLAVGVSEETLEYDHWSVD